MRKNIVLITIALGNSAGGLEKNFVRVANHYAKSNDVTVVTFDWPAASSFFSLSKNISWHRIGNSTPHGKITHVKRLMLILKLRKILKEKTDPIIIGFHHGITLRLLAASMFMSRKIIISERNSLSLYDYINGRKYNTNLLGLIFVNKITVQFQEYIKDYPSILKRKLVVIPNAVNKTSNSQIYVKNQTEKKVILSIGRFCTQKQFHLLISAFSLISPQHPQWKLVLVGDGNLKTSMRKLVKELGLQHAVEFLPNQSNLNPIYESSDLFCTTSQWEGFPNALAEAMSYGIPAVGFATCSGVNHLIKHKETGLLVFGPHTTPNLALALQELITKTSLRREMSEASKKRMSVFLPGEVYGKWDDLITNI